MAEQKLDNLKIAEVASLTNKQVEEFKQEVSDREPTVNDLEQLIEAEKAGKDREEMIDYLKGMINKKNISEKLQTALDDLSGLEHTIKEVEDLEDTESLKNKDEVEIDQSQIIELIEGTVSELKDYVNENFLYRRQLEEILDAEKAGKNRKTAKRFLEKEIESKGIEEEIKESQEDLERLKKDIKNLKNHFENVAEEYDYSGEQRSKKNQEAANELLEITNSIIQELKDSDNIDNRQELEEKTNEVIQALQNDNYSKVEDALVAISKMGRPNQEEDETEKSEDGSGGDPDEDEQKNEQKTVETQETMQEQDEKLERMKQIVQDIEESEDELEEEMEENSRGPEFEKKKSIAEGLRTSFSDEDIENITVQELQELKREQEHREELISKLKEQGLDEQDLRDSSTSDLEKLFQTSQSMNERQSNFEEPEEEKKSSEELRQEAEEDLEELKGAVKSADFEEETIEEEQGPSTSEKIEGFKQQIKSKFERDTGEESEGMNESEVRNVLENYRELEDKEASVKVAHVMKSYLESKLNVQREMTYRELSERIPTDQNEDMRRLSQFFQKMHKQEYTDSIQIDDVDEVIDNCEAVLDKMG